jgi:Domain of unknown function (DUF4383)
LFIGIAYVSIGLLGLVPAALTPPPPDAPKVAVTTAYGYLLGVFPVNVLHSIVHLAIGVLGVLAWQADHVWHRMTSPKMFARAVAILVGALAVIGLIPAMNTLFGLLPLHGHDVWLHLGTAAAAAYFGWRSESELERRDSPAPDRREKTVPVEHDRRLGHADRRAPGSEV